MATKVVLTPRPDGTLVVSKTPLSGDRRDRLAEARWLEQAGLVIAQTDHRGPTQRGGVVTLLPADPAPDDVAGSCAGPNSAGPSHTPASGQEPPTIVTERVPGETLRTTWLGPAGVAGALARVTELLADLHDVGLVHGNLTLDHVILGPEGPRLCSPDGCATDPGIDARALGRCIEALLARWDRLEVEVGDRAEWERLAQNMAAEAEPLPLRRLVVAFDRLAATADPHGDRLVPDSRVRIAGRLRRHLDRTDKAQTTNSRSGLVAVGLMVMVSLAGLTLGLRRPDTAAAGPVITSDRHRYQIDRAHAEIAVVPDPCPGQPWAISLDPATDTVWGFEEPPPTLTPGQPAGRGVVLFVVPGAERFEITTDGPCPSIWASGPAGRTLVIGG